MRRGGCAVAAIVAMGCAGKGASDGAADAGVDSTIVDTTVADTREIEVIVVDDSTSFDANDAPDSLATSDALADLSPAVEAACAAWGENECAAMARCTPFYLARDYGDLATCDARMKIACELIAIAPDVGSGFASAMATCASIAPTCADYRNATRDPSCAPTGSRGMGAPCGYAAQCAAGFTCFLAPSSTCGTCLPLGGDGACHGPNPETICAPGTFCPEDGTTCIPYPAEGDACHLRVCAPADACLGGATCQSYLQSAGDHCDINDTNGGCDPGLGLYCDAPSGGYGPQRCASTPVATTGSACDAGVCSGGGGSCSYSRPCAPAVPEGSACSDGPCLLPAACDPLTNTCAFPDVSRCG